MTKAAENERKKILRTRYGKLVWRFVVCFDVNDMGKVDEQISSLIDGELGDATQKGKLGETERSAYEPASDEFSRYG